MHKVDHIKVNFKQTDYFVEASKEGIFTIPDDFEIVSVLPP